MKKTLLVVVALISCTTSFAQWGPGFGIKGGLNYAGNGDYFDSAEQAFEDPNRNAGFHLGIFGKLGGGDDSRVYLRPELIYTSTKSGYDEGDLKIKKLDAPVLLGFRILKIPVPKSDVGLNIFGGPSFQYILDTEFDGITVDDIESEFTVGLNLGVGIDLGKRFGVDLRYERGFSENEINFINTNLTNVNDRVDTRPDQLILSLSLNF